MPITLNENEIHLWLTSVEEVSKSSLFEHYKSVISTNELNKYKEFLLKKDSDQYLTTRALVRFVLSRYIPHIKPENWIFTENAYGKPEVVPGLLSMPLKFNISHTHDLIVLAISLDQEIGVDIEWLSRRTEINKLAAYSLSSDEYKQLKNLDPPQLKERFYALWTLKEAYVKACGIGLSLPLNSFSFFISDSNCISVKLNSKMLEDNVFWGFWQIKPDNQYIISLAIKSMTRDASFKMIMKSTLPFGSHTHVTYPITAKSL